MIAPQTGFACFQSLDGSNPGFRVAATGTILGVDESTEIVKKLKLTGAPYEIFKNTAFIKNMFSSGLKLPSLKAPLSRRSRVSEGQIKRALSKPDGHFRATFEVRCFPFHSTPKSIPR